MKHDLRSIPLILIFAIVPVLLLWIPFLLRMESFWGIPLQSTGLATIVSNYDGPLYIVIAKTFYNTEAIKSMFSIPLPVEYYAAHFPLYPLIIKFFSLILNFPYALLSASLVGSVLATYFFYKLILEFVDKKDALWMLLLFAVLPARWLIVRSVGSPESLFVAFMIASVYFFKNKKYWLAGIFGALAQFTKSPGILLFVAYAGFFIFDAIQSAAKSKKYENLGNIVNAFPTFLIPVSLIGLFLLYSKTFGNFFAYFNSGDNIHLFFPPFQIFNYSQPWVNTFWLEEVLLVYIIGLLGIFKLFERKQYEYAIFAGVFFSTIFFVSHRDVIRYALPVVPFILAGFSETLTKKSFKLLMLIVILPIYLFSLAYISQNVMPISDWGPFL